MRRTRTTRPLLALIATLVCASASAQVDVGTPQVPDDWLDRTNRMRGDSLTVCINTESLMATFERDLWQAIADALLLDLEVRDIRGRRAQPILDYSLSLSDTELYQVLYNGCQALGGFLLSTSQFPTWMTITRPYLEMRFVVATTTESVAKLGDFTPDDKVGTRMGTAADLAFIDQAGTQPDQRRFRRVPYPNNQLIIDRLQDGELDAIIIWEPGLAQWLAGQGDATSIRVIASDPIRLPTQSFGIVLLQRESFLRSVLDDAIAVLSADGTIDRLLAAHGLPGQPPRP